MRTFGVRGALRFVTSSDRTRLTYRLEYDPAMANAVFGFPVPAVLVECAYSVIMSSYLTKLRYLLQSGRV